MVRGRITQQKGKVPLSKNHDNSDYRGKHRKADPPTIPQRVIRFIDERYRVHDDPNHLFTHQTQQLHRKGNPKR